METSERQFLIFGACRGLFALGTSSVIETFGLPEITPLESPHTSFVGVINLRGTIIPVQDLNVRFGRPPEKFRLSDGVIVVFGEVRPIGIIVNEVLDVITIPEEDVGPPPFPDSEGSSPSRFTLGLAKVGEDIIAILDPQKLVASEFGEEGAKDAKYLDNDRSGPPFSPEFPPDEKASFHERAGDLRKESEKEELDELDQVAVVSLGDEYFGIEVKAIQEFAALTNLTPIPNCPNHIVGNMNLRGHILTVIDIRGPLGMPPGKISRSSKIMVTTAGNLLLGVAVDEIHDITNLRPKDISPLPASVRCDIEKHAKGTAQFAGKAMTVLNLSEILKSPGLVVDGE